MINTDLLNEKISNYLKWCELHERRPTKKGIAMVLGISYKTVCNVIKGEFNHHKYTDKPHIKRCIDNIDFKVIQNIFIYN